MPTTPIRARSKVVHIQVDASINSGTLVYVQNQTTGDRWITKVNAAGEALVDLANKNVDGDDSTVTVSGQVIQASVLGKSYGFGTVTIGNQQDNEIKITTLTTDDGLAIVI